MRMVQTMMRCCASRRKKYAWIVTAPIRSNGPRGKTIQEHTHHNEGSAGSDCLACHMPRIEQTLADVNVRSHTFRFVTPAETDSLQVPNACNVCHKDKSTKWAGDSLKAWAQYSPWRMQK
jgi:hypothetical protein